MFVLKLGLVNNSWIKAMTEGEILFNANLELMTRCVADTFIRIMTLFFKMPSSTKINSNWVYFDFF